MKKLILSVVAAVAACACSSMIDEIAPKNYIKAETLNQEDIGKLCNGVRYKMESVVKSVWFRGDWLSENFSSGPGFDVADVHAETQSAASSIALSDWRTLFTTLNEVNELLRRASGIEGEKAKEALGNACFFRAWIYYNLVIRYGGVPVLKAPTMEVVPFSGEDAVWEFIISDLQDAIEVLPDHFSIYYPGKDAAKLLLARVFLWRGRNSEAAALAGEVINDSHALNGTSEDFARMFVYGTESREIILALANIRSTGYNLVYDSVNDVDGSWNYSPAPKYYRSLYGDTAFHTGDIRAAATFSPDDATRLIKFPNGGSGMNQFVVNAKASNSPLVMFRLADAYLIRAEALGPGAGLAVLREFMEHRYASVNLPSTMGEKEYQTLILDENNREFFGEGRRWFDIKRTGRTDLYDTWNGRDFLLYWPIPQKERDIAGKDVYPQNNGYSD